MVRPEQLRFLRADEAEDNEVAGVVGEVILTGQITHHAVDVSGGSKISVSCLTGAGMAAPSEGEHVRVGWSRRATTILQPAN